MPVESEADRAVFLNPDEFGAVVSWQGAPAPLAVLSQSGTLLVGSLDGPDTQMREATLILREADLPGGADQDDAVTLNGVAYLVRSIEPDGTGLVLVRLELSDA
ncbi:MAG: hypothetical protein KIT02_10310 [Devosia sp.]|uniref:head-tail joining protein n=1 Tax=Devosia sp. TaxID=1871048 RepID=UPI0024CC4895|nr:hypothetical protein [Devosia sp.]UYN98359.1 MAG: hypothetical protein KIT02_10310 [Devosia sp.]